MTRKILLRTDATGMVSLRSDDSSEDILRSCVFAPNAGGRVLWGGGGGRVLWGGGRGRVLWGGGEEKLVEGVTSPRGPVFIRDTPEYVDEFFTRATSLWVTDTVFCWPHVGRGEELFAEGDTVAFTA